MPHWMRTRTLRTFGLLFALTMMLSACGRIGDLIGGGGPDPGDVSCESEASEVTSESEPVDVTDESEPDDVSDDSEPDDVSSESEPECESEDVGAGKDRKPETPNGIPHRIQRAAEDNL
jgi:hypothetical protein